MLLNKKAAGKILLCLCLLANGLAWSQDSSIITLWQNGAPGFESRKSDPEQAKDWWVRNINNPTLTVFTPPAGKGNKTAVIICPGGGFTNLVFNAEGVEAARYFNSIGVTAFVLKYRLFRMENSPYKEENPWQDIFRATRMVKSLANEYQIDTNRIGVMGFSAGGEVAGWLSYHWQESHVAGSGDAIDKLNARPAFQVLIYPGPLAVPAKVESNAPSTFLLASNDDACCSQPIIQLVQMHRQAKVPVEMHLYAKGNHAFNMGYRSEFSTLKNWPQRLTEWLDDNGWLKQP
jgi:acetyl esterase/lipase